MDFITIFDDSYPDYRSRIDTRISLYKLSDGEWRMSVTIETETLCHDEKRGAYTERATSGVVHNARKVLEMLEKHDAQRWITIGSSSYEYLSFNFDGDLITKITAERSSAETHLYKGTLIRSIKRVMEENK